MKTSTHLLAAVLFLVTVAGANAIVYSHNQTFNTGGNFNGLIGIVITPNQNITLYNFTKTGGTGTGSGWVLALNSTGANITTGSWSTNLATLNGTSGVNLTAGTAYIIGVQASGSSAFAEVNPATMPVSCCNMTINTGFFWPSTRPNNRLFVVETIGYDLILPPTSPSLRINATDFYNGTPLTTFNASIVWNGTTTTWSTTNGTIQTNLTVNTTLPANITVTPTQTNYFAFAQTFTNYNTTTLQFNATPWTIVRLRDSYNSTNLTTFNATYNGTTYTTSSSFVYIPLFGNSTPISFSANNYFTNTTTPNGTPYLQTLNATITPFTLIRAIAFNGTTINNFSINWTGTFYNGSTSTNNGIAYAPIFNATYNVTIYDAQQGSTIYASASANLAGTPYLQGYNFTNLLLSTSFYITFRDEDTLNVINTTTISLFVTSNGTSYNYTTTNGYINATLLSPNSYVLTYFGGSYTQREITATLGEQEAVSLTLYLLPNSTGTYIRFTVYDQVYQPLRGAIINANKKNLSGTNYFNVQDCVTDVNGECLMFLETLTTTYQFITQYQSVTRQSGDTILSRDTYPIVMNIFSSTLRRVNARNDVSTALNYSGGTFTFTVNDASNLVTQADLVVQRRFGGRMLDVGSTTGSGSSFAISVTGVNISLGDETLAYGYIYINGERVLVQQRSVIERPGFSEYAQGFAFVVLGMIFTIVFIFTWNPVAPIIAFAGFIVIMSRVGMVVIGWPAVVAFIIIIGAVIYRMRNI